MTVLVELGRSVELVGRDIVHGDGPTPAHVVGEEHALVAADLTRAERALHVPGGDVLDVAEQVVEGGRGLVGVPRPALVGALHLAEEAEGEGVVVVEEGVEEEEGEGAPDGVGGEAAVQLDASEVEVEHVEKDEALERLVDVAVGEWVKVHEVLDDRGLAVAVEQELADIGGETAGVIG